MREVREMDIKREEGVGQTWSVSDIKISSPEETIYHYGKVIGNPKI